MGNHTAGLAMGRMATAKLLSRGTQTAMAMLNEICERYRGCDAEFKAEDPKRPGAIHPDFGRYTDPAGPLGILIAEAFGTPGHDYQAGFPKDAKAFAAWDDGPYQAFDEHYEFC